MDQLAQGSRAYRLGHTYVDKGSVKHSDDQFLRWINAMGVGGIRNMGGIRPIKFVQLPHSIPSSIILVTDARTTGSASNPWEDLIDLPAGRILYWGDAKFSEKTVDQFIGNRALRTAWEQVLDNHRQLVPPILHFSKVKTGEIRFNGLCALDHLELTWFEDEKGRPIRNYRAHLSILDDEFVDVTWIHARALAGDVDSLTRGGPITWQRYMAGYLDRLRIWAPALRSTSAQLPPEDSPDAAVLRQLVAMSPTEFEAAVVSAFRELKDVRHEITRTRPTADGGFDFFGTFLLPPPLRYEIGFLGEAKRFGSKHAVQPKHVSRLVARLGRGQYGVFVTTSYFTRQTQEEVLRDGYPTTLVSGGDLIRMMRELRIVRQAEISKAWLSAVAAEMERGLSPYSSPTLS